MKYEYNIITNSEYLGDRFLNHLGEEGWELISHTYIFDRHMHYYAFKREKEAIDVNAILYRDIQNTVIDWSNDGTKTAGELTRSILKLIK